MSGIPSEHVLHRYRATEYYGVKPQELPDNLRDLNGQLEYLMRPAGIMRRTVTLEKGWYRDG